MLVLKINTGNVLEKNVRLCYYVSKEVILPVLKQNYDLIIIDTPPEDSPLIWAADEAADGILVAVSPREYDYASTTDFMLTISERFKQSPSKGDNLKWFKVLAVNVDDKVHMKE